MRTKNAMQLKAKIKARAKKANISPQLLMQDYLLERLLERISRSAWRDKVIIKGGMLIASLIGVDNRVTKDLDTTVQGFLLSHESAEAAFREILSIDLNDDIEFEFTKTEDIREEDEYPGIKVFLKAHYPPMRVPLTVDMTTGDAITPAPLAYNYQLFFEDYSIPLVVYPMATCLAEKLETTIRRGRTSTRPRDYYDIHAIWTTRRHELNLLDLNWALKATSAKRNSTEAISGFHLAMEQVANDETMLRRWEAFVKDYSYARGLTLPNACQTVCEILEAIGWQ